ncbi:four-carbon acid sugar kinase family protein [Acidisphaera sp. L21]|uniref:four-carbon acid sugar kinase family protein n=1 Tax=Acidisphaera sp. L21 TaxID=1641851 RepID=UPI00131C6579|nr:four-carbon acid sugar kinase family protein [Acidisphaera sp. L21]
MAPRFGWYGDDFTGATDTLANWAEAGYRALLFLGVPSTDQLAAAGPLDAVGIAGAARAMTPAAMAEELVPVGRFFAGLGVRVMHYKCCSTFDSAPAIGSIGAAIATLQPFFPNAFLPIVGGQPNIGRFCLFSHLFAAAGTGGVVHRLDRHPTMAVHPVTPMGEADLRRHLAAQGLDGIAGLHYPAYEPDLAAVLAATLQSAPAAILLDVSRDADLAPVGRAIWSHAQAAPLLAVGPSSVAQALARGEASVPFAGANPLRPADGPVLVLAGSLSPVTAAQVAASPSYVPVVAQASQLAADPAYAQQLRTQVVGLLSAGRSVLVRTSQPDGPPQAPGAVAEATARLLGDVLKHVRLQRVGIAGGDTSSQATIALGLWGLSYLTSLAPGVAICRAHSAAPGVDGVEIMLKGGQMGSPQLFEHLLHGNGQR